MDKMCGVLEVLVLGYSSRAVGFINWNPTAQPGEDSSEEGKTTKDKSRGFKTHRETPDSDQDHHQTGVPEAKSQCPKLVRQGMGTESK